MAFVEFGFSVHGSTPIQWLAICRNSHFQIPRLGADEALDNVLHGDLELRRTDQLAVGEGVGGQVKTPPRPPAEGLRRSSNHFGSKTSLRQLGLPRNVSSQYVNRVAIAMHNVAGEHGNRR